MSPADATELVLLLDDDGKPVGTAPKATVHTTDTPLHFAFSCHVFNSAGRMLLTRRALTKDTFAGVWTNAFCGHPAPGEKAIDRAGRVGQQKPRDRVDERDGSADDSQHDRDAPHDERVDADRSTPRSGRRPR